MIRTILMTTLLAVTACSTPAQAEKGNNLTEAELIGLVKHAVVDADIPPGERKSTGATTFREALTGRVLVTGTSSLASTLSTLQLTMHFMAPTYPGELITLNGQKVDVQAVQNASRSPLGNLLALHPELLKEGLFGGSLSARWPFIGDTSKIRMKSEGLKKWNGRTVLSVQYSPHSNGTNGELQIHIYLDPETYQQLATVYRLRTENSSGDMRSNDEQRTEFLEERFSEFSKVGEMTLPHHWEIRYNVDSDSAKIFSWDTEFSTVQ